MAAIDPPLKPDNAGLARRAGLGHAILATAMTLPCIQASHAEQAPEHGVISYRHLDYKDWQPGDDRVSVKAHAFRIMAPLSEKVSLEGSYTIDTVSGASPFWWTRNLANMHDERKAYNLAATYYRGLDTLNVSASFSTENDYRSKAISLTGSHSSEDRNTTWHYAFGLTDDRITALALDDKKNISDILLGITQVVSVNDIIQINLTHSDGHGLYSDPYKAVDNRPRSKQQNALLTRWNHHFADLGDTLRLSYRYYTDSWSIHAHTLTGEFVMPLSGGWTITPSVRYHSQDKADFYLDQAAFPGIGPYRSTDQRLSDFGAWTAGIAVAKQIDDKWTFDIKYEQYAQKADWHLGGDGSPGLDTFHARFVQLGVSRTF